MTCNNLGAGVGNVFVFLGERIFDGKQGFQGEATNPGFFFTIVLKVSGRGNEPWLLVFHRAKRNKAATVSSTRYL